MQFHVLREAVRYKFSPGAAQLFDRPSPYILVFERGSGLEDQALPQLLIGSDDSDPRLLQARVEGEEFPSDEPGLILNSLPLWPVALVEPEDQTASEIAERLLTSLPRPIEEAISRIPAGAASPDGVQAALAETLAGLLGHAATTDRALAELRAFHEETQRAFRELEEYVLNNGKFDPSLPPVRLPRGNQSIRLDSGASIVQRLVASSYRFAGVEIDISSVPKQGGELMATVKRDGEHGPWISWNLDLPKAPGAVLFRLERASMEKSAPLTLELRANLASAQEVLEIAATASQTGGEYNAEVLHPGRPRRDVLASAVAHAVHRGLPGTQYPHRITEVLPRELADDQPPALTIVRADFDQASVLHPPGAVLDQLRFPVVTQDHGELQVHPVSGERVLVAIPTPKLEIGAILRVPVRIAHAEGTDLIGRFLYGPQGAGRHLIRLLPSILGEEQDSEFLEELAMLGATATSHFSLNPRDGQIEIALPIAQSSEQSSNLLYIALRTRREDAPVSFSWFRIAQPRCYRPALEQRAGMSADA